MARGRVKKEKIVWGGWPSDSDLSVALVGAIISAAESLKIVNEEKENMKDIYKEMKEVTGIPARHFSFLVKMKLDEELKNDFENKSEALISDAEQFQSALEKME